MDHVDQILNDTEDEAKAARESPILATVQAISRYPGFQGRNRHFVWFSDGIENSETAQFCHRQGDMPPAAKFVQRPDYDVIRPDTFAGTEVTVLLAETISLPQRGLDFCTDDEMRRWWPDYFRINGADHVRLQRLRRVAGS